MERKQAARQVLRCISEFLHNNDYFLSEAKTSVEYWRWQDKAALMALSLTPNHGPGSGCLFLCARSLQADSELVAELGERCLAHARATLPEQVALLDPINVAFDREDELDGLDPHADDS